MQIADCRLQSAECERQKVAPPASPSPPAPPAPPLTVAFLSLLALSCQPSLPETEWAVTNVNTIDVRTGEIARDVAIIVEDNRIASVVASSSVGRGDVVDGEGAFVIPGLWDMHAHVTGDTRPEVLPAFVANGVTGIRDMGGPVEIADQYLREIAAGALVGPRIVRSGLVIDGPKPDVPNRITVTNAAEGRAAVQQLASQGVDHIKIHNAVPRDAYFAVAEEARAQNLPLTGHIPVKVEPDEALGAGQTTIEHIATIFEGTMAGDIRDPFEQLAALQSFVNNGADTLAAHFVANRNWFSPTMIAYRQRALKGRPAVVNDERLRYIPTALRARWDEWFPITAIDTNSVIMELRLRADTLFTGVVNRFHKSGVRMLAATDFGGRDIYPGFSLHDELALLVEAGLTPLEAIQTATINPAEYLGALDSLGVVQPGHLADFVLLSANPLEDIQNTTRISAVAANGRYLSREALDGLLAEVESAAR